MKKNIYLTGKKFDDIRIFVGVAPYRSRRPVGHLSLTSLRLLFPKNGEILASPFSGAPSGYPDGKKRKQKTTARVGSGYSFMV